MSEQLSIRLAELWDLADVDLPTIAETLAAAAAKVDEVRSSNLAEAFVEVEELGSLVRSALDWYRQTLKVTVAHLADAAEAVKAVVADYATTDVELSDELRRAVAEFIELNPEYGS
ncbi:MAG TPA: hypothetical protein VIL37_00375 [Natronosporangium sp.]